MVQKNGNKKCDSCNRIISVLYEKLERSNDYLYILGNPNFGDLSERDFVQNILYDGICDIASQKLIVEYNEGKWDDELSKKFRSAYDLMAENWSVLNEKTMYTSYYPIVERKFKQLYKNHARLCEKLFPIVFFIIIDNIQKIKAKDKDETYKCIRDCLLGVRREDYIYSILDDMDNKRKKLSGEKQRVRFQEILINSESDIIRKFFPSGRTDNIINSEETNVLDLVELDLLDWNDETTYKNKIWVDKVRKMYLRNYRRKEKFKNAEKMFALFQFVSATWGDETNNKWYSYDKELTLYVINQTTSWINLLFLHLYKANYIFLLANASLYSVSNYLMDEKNKQKESHEQSNFFMRIADLSFVYELIEEAYTSGEKQDKLELKKGLDIAAEHILEVIRKYLKRPDKLQIEQAINYALYIYLYENMGNEKEYSPRLSLDKMLEECYDMT